MKLIKARFFGEIVIKACDIGCVKEWLETNPDLMGNEYVHITEIEEVENG